MTKNRKNANNFKGLLLSSALPRQEVEILMASIVDKSREFFLIHPEEKITAKDYKTFCRLEKKRLANWPISYLTGHKEFYGLDFLITPATLVPRPETELIIEEVINCSRTANSLSKTKIIDLGTGSGAIIISLANELKRLLPDFYKEADFIGIDISKKALQIAKKNSLRHGFKGKIKFRYGNLLSPIVKDLKNQDLMISANLPYLTKEQIKHSPTISREPKLALDGGKDGLEYYEKLFKQLKKANFKRATVFCEIDPSQTKKISILTSKYFSAFEQKLIKDLSGQNRLFMVKL